MGGITTNNKQQTKDDWQKKDSWMMDDGWLMHDQWTHGHTCLIMAEQRPSDCLNKDEQRMNDGWSMDEYWTDDGFKTVEQLIYKTVLTELANSRQNVYQGGGLGHRANTNQN